jgi:diphthamide synthase (EF-2-diphthine--ammonia ligase)
VKAQAEAAGLPLWDVDLPWPCSNDDYQSAMRTVCERALQAGVECMAFGDLFLTEIRDYREKQLSGSGLQPVFPVWGIPTDVLARDMIAAGLRAKLTCVDRKQIEPHFAGREFDAKLLTELPTGADPCGENGEFHSFVYAGPMFRGAIPVKSGEVIHRDQFAFADLVPAESEPS